MKQTNPDPIRHLRCTAPVGTLICRFDPNRIGELDAPFDITIIVLYFS